jgi:outer membrane immunogenic protein
MATLASPVAAQGGAYESPRFNWTGFYIGGNAGAGWLSADAHLFGDRNSLQCFITGGPFCNADLTPPPVPPSFNLDDTNFLGGVQAGYNQQFARLLLGVEGDFSWGSLEDTRSSTNIVEFRGFIPEIPFTTKISSELDWLATVRGKFGALATPRLLLYMTAGVAFGEINQKLQLATGKQPLASAIFIGGAGGSFFGCNVPSVCLAGLNSETSVGWTVGGGFEFALSPRLSLKGEYLFVELGNESVKATPGPSLSPPDVFLASRTDFEVQVARVGVNYKFGGR